MSRIFITGSSDGLGLLAARRLADEGHEVVLHARSRPRARETTEKVANAAIHNAGIGYREPRWDDVFSNALEPGWVPTKMGGSGAPGDLESGIDTQCWLATSDEPAARVSGRYFYRRAERSCHPAARDEALQDGLLDRCAELSGVKIA
jgi:hypothetical protein